MRGGEIGLEEIFASTQCQVICFRHSGGYRLNVYYATRTIGTVLGKGSTQFYRHNCTQEELIEILQNPKIHSHHWQGLSGIIKLSSHKAIDVEEDFRNRLARLDKEIFCLLEKRRSICKSISSHEQDRYQKATSVWKQQKQHQEHLKKELMTKFNALQVRQQPQQKNSLQVHEQGKSGTTTSRRSSKRTSKSERYVPSFAMNLQVATDQNSLALSSFSSIKKSF